MEESKVKELEILEAKGNTYHFLGTQDRHLVRLLHWAKELEVLQNEVRESEEDDELFDELNVIRNRLISEIGIRMTLIFP